MGDSTHTISDYSNGDVYLRMDGSGVSEPMPDGGGVVNCQVGAGPWEQFNIVKQDDGYYAIESVQFPGVFLRIDGRNLTADNPIGGVVNCQFGVGPWEKFKVTVHQFGMSIESVQFPNVFLRMDSDSCSKPNPSGCGTVNAQYGFDMTPPVRDVFIIVPPVDPNT